MTWLKLDDEILDNEKILELDAEAFGFHIAAMTWCARNLTDGRVPHGKVATLIRMRSREPAAVVAELVAAGLWTEAGKGYEIHDYLDFNPSREKVLAERQRGTDRKEKSRQAARPISARPRPCLGEASPVPRADSVSASRGPDPDPDPVTADPPNPPSGGLGLVEGNSEPEKKPEPASRVRLRDDGVFGQTQESWREGIGMHTRLSVAALGRSDAADLNRMIEAHAGGLTGELLCAWVRDTALAFARGAEARYGLTPRRCVLWLDAGRPSRASPEPASPPVDTSAAAIAARAAAALAKARAEEGPVTRKPRVNDDERRHIAGLASAVGVSP